MRCHWMLLLFPCLVWAGMSVACGSAAADDPDPKLVAKFQKKAEVALKKGKGEFYAVAFLKSTWNAGNVERRSTRVAQQNGQLLQDNATEFKTGEYCPEAEFMIIEGKDAALEAIVEHMTPYLAAPPKKKKKSEPMADPPPQGDWKVIGRFVDQEKADAAIEKAQQAYDAQPRWQPASN